MDDLGYYGWFAMENPIKWNLETDKPWQTLGPFQHKQNKYTTPEPSLVDRRIARRNFFEALFLSEG